MKIEQFDIIQVDLNPVKGSEQKGIRPCLVLQTNASSGVARTFLIAPFSSKRVSRIFSYQVLIPKSAKNKLAHDSKLKLDQIRVVDKERFVKKIGKLEPDYYPKVFTAMDVIFDRFGDFWK